MSHEAFPLVGPDAAVVALKSFGEPVRLRGETLHAAGAVRAIVCEKSGTKYRAEVVDGRTLGVTLHYVRGKWAGVGDTPGVLKEEYIYAALKQLLADHSGAAAQDLSSRSMKSTKLTTTSEALALAAELEESLGRQLLPKELVSVETLLKLFRGVQLGGTLVISDLQRLGFKPVGDGFAALDLWADPPRTATELWHYIALHAENQGWILPEQFKPISDIAELRDRMVRARRGAEIRRWRETIGGLVLGGAEEGTAGSGVELRLRFTETEAIVEWRSSAGSDRWQLIKPGQFANFDKKYGRDLAGEQALLWQPFAQRAAWGYNVEMPYHDVHAQRLLHQLLRLPALGSNMVGPAGEPLERPTEPLRWDLTAAATEEDDYRFRLVQVDGSPVPPIIVALLGRPNFFVTTETVFMGPSVEKSVTDPKTETRIPALALESSAGIKLLQHLGISMPPRLADKVRVIHLKPVLRAELLQPVVGYDSESCFLDVLGEVGDGTYAERWNGHSWQDVKLTPANWGNATAVKDPDDNAPLVTYDRSGLAGLPPLIEPAGFKWDFARQRWQMRVTKAFPEKFVPWLKSLPPEYPIELRGELASFLNAEVSGRVKLVVEESDIDWFDLSVIVDVSDATLTKEEVKLLLEARGKWVRLGTKGWRKLEFNFTPEEDEQLARLGLTSRELSNEKQRLHTLQLADPAAKKFLGDDAFAKVQRRAAEIQARVTPEIPVQIIAELRPYQKEGFHFLAYLSTNRFGGILADDMGLGKTLQTLTWIAWVRNLHSARKNGSREISVPMLVCCPKSVADNWRAEASRFLPELKVRAWRTDDVKGFKPEAADLHILNYNQLRILGEILPKIEFHAIILDEGQYIKNPLSVTAMIASKLRTHHRLVLSGTPIENKLMDLWSLMNFAMPGALGSRNEFQRLYEVKGDPYARQRLAARVRPFLLRRTKTQVAKDLPDRIEEDLFCEMEGDQRTMYRAELKRAQSTLLGIQTPKALSKERFNLLTSLLRLRQICCDPRLVREDYSSESAKLEALMEQLEPLMEEGQKVLVFSQFVEMLEILRRALAARNWTTYFLAGETENRGELVQKFQAHEGAATFLISLKAGGFGLNLTAASYVVLFDPWWNPAVEAQAIDRSHRIGQTQKVIAYRLLIKDSIEEKIRALQKQKKSLAEDVLGEEKFAQSLTLDDLRFLLAD